MQPKQGHPVMLGLMIAWAIAWFALMLWALLDPAGVIDLFNRRLGRVFDMPVFGFTPLMFLLYIPSQTLIMTGGGSYQRRKRALPAESTQLRWLRDSPLILVMLALIGGAWVILGTPPLHLSLEASVQFGAFWFSLFLGAALVTRAWILSRYGWPGEAPAQQSTQPRS